MDKIRVDIVGLNGTKTKLCKVQGDKIIIRPRNNRKRIPAYTATFNEKCYVPYKKSFGRRDLKLTLYEGASKCVEWHRGKNGVNIPNTSREDVKNLFNVHAVEKAGQISKDVKIPVAFYIIMVIILIVSILGLFVSSGNVSIG